MDLVQATWYSKGSPRRARELIVLHDMETPDVTGTALAVARYFQRLPATNKASAHICVDKDTAVRCVNDDDIAYGAPPANHNGLHIELAGYSKYSSGQWTQDDLLSMLYRAVPIVADWCQQYGIPMRFVPAAELAPHDFNSPLPPEVHGITTHFEVNQAWRQTSHTDPGKGFPIAWFIDAVNKYAAHNSIPKPSTDSTPDPSQEDEDMPQPTDIVDEITYPNGAKTRVTRAGQVLALGTRYMYGIDHLLAEEKQAWTEAGGITAINPVDPNAGYVIWDRYNGNQYAFSDAEAQTIAAREKGA